MGDLAALPQPSGQPQPKRSSPGSISHGPVELTLRSRAAQSGRSCRDERTTHGHRFCKETPFPLESRSQPTRGKARSTRRCWFPRQKKGMKRTVGFLGPPCDAAGLVVWETLSRPGAPKVTVDLKVNIAVVSCS
jgi:hypothetical protein